MLYSYEEISLNNVEHHLLLYMLANKLSPD